MDRVNAGGVAERVARPRQRHKAEIRIQAEDATVAPVRDPEAGTGGDPLLAEKAARVCHGWEWVIAQLSSAC